MEAIQYRVSGTSLSGQSIDRYAVTNPLGVAVFEHLPIGSYTITELSASEVPKPAAVRLWMTKARRFLREQPELMVG